MDKDERARALLGVCVDGPDLWLADRDGKNRVSLAVPEDGPGLRLRDKGGKNRCVLGVTELEVTSTGTKTTTSESLLVLFDKDGKVIHQAGK